jgi:di/tricarboxylate transporter
MTVEAVIAPGSRLDGRTVDSLRLSRRWGVTLLGLSRQGRQHQGRLRDFRLRTGDVLLLLGDRERLAQAMQAFDCLPLAGRGITVGRRGRPWLPVAIFAGAIALATLGLFPIYIALGLAALGMIAIGALPLRDIYDAVDWPVIVLLGALIPVGGAMETTGATGLITDAIAGATRGLPAFALVALLLVVTMTLSDVLNNAATAVVMAPIAASLADRLGASPDPFLMAVAVGASCAFLTPIGHQNNALIMGPGGYAFGDYWRMGLPLEILIVAVATPMILLVWPL